MSLEMTSFSRAVDKLDVDVQDKIKMGPPAPDFKPKRNWTSSNKYLFNADSLQLPEDIKKVKNKKKRNVLTTTPQTASATVTPSTTDKKTDFICHLCEGSFSSACSLQKHLKRHTGERPFECGTCKKRFFTKFSLNRHTLATHDPDSTLGKRILCNICDKRFASKEWLVVHLRSHTGENPFACEHCDKKFTCQNGLSRHSLTHKTDKSFLCYECGKTFQSSQSMRVHLESHSTDRKYNCDKCRMRFKRALDLQRHGLVHREVPMLSCPLPQCEHQFRRKDNLLRHLQLTHDQTREEAHETFNMLDTSCRTSSRGRSGPSSVVGISDVQSEISCITEDSETTQDSTILSHSQPLKSRRTKVRSKQVVKNKTNHPPNGQSSKSKPRNSRNLSVQVETVIQNQEITPFQTTPTSQMCRATSDLEDPVTLSPTKSSCTSVTTSVIRLVKSSPNVVNPTQPVSSRKRTKRSWEFNNPDQKDEQRSSPPPFQTLLTTPAPYPSRNPSPGQEYINYLNSLNNPVAFRVRDRSSSFTNRNQYSSQPSYKHCYEGEDGLSYSLESNPVNFTNSYSFPSTSLPRESVDHARKSSTLHLTPLLYNAEERFEYSSVPVDGIHHTHFHQECSNSVGYLDLSSSDPDKRRISFEPSSPRSHYQIADATSIPNTFLPVYNTGQGSNYLHSVHDLTEELVISRIPQEEEYYNYNNIVPLLPVEPSTNVPRELERPCNVTVIKRASASTSQNKNVHPPGFSGVQNHQECSQNLMQAGPQFEAQDGRERRLSAETGSVGSQQHMEHEHSSGGKDIIVNRDPRKNFLHRESFSRSRNQD